MSGGNSPNGSSNRIAIISALIAAAATIAAALIATIPKPPPINESIKFSGRVVNAKTETVIRKAKITLEAEGAPSVMYTDSEGFFSFLLKNSTDLVRVRVEVNGYENFDRLISPSGKTLKEEIKLVPRFSIPKPSVSNSLPIPTISTQKNTNYIKLRKFLADGKFKEADQETNKILLQLTGNDSFNDTFDAARIDCKVYQTIDSLWREYSKNKYGSSKFGFSVQIRIFQEKKNIDEFGDFVGWRVSGEWLNYTDLNKTLEEAPEGYFPSRYRGSKSSSSKLSSAWMIWSFLPLPGSTTDHCLNGSTDPLIDNKP
jgi:GUN4-like